MLVNSFSETFFAKIDLENEISQMLANARKCSRFLTCEIQKYFCDLHKNSEKNY